MESLGKVLNLKGKVLPFTEDKVTLIGKMTDNTIIEGEHNITKYPKKIKDNKYSTSKDILDKIRFVHPIVDKILEYRTLAKLYTNYAVGLKNEVRDDGRIHTIFTQTLTRTGRLSSIEPNLQNIPIRFEEGKLIRKAFVPEEGCTFISSDYSQIELRILAHISGDEIMIKAFNDGDDIHKRGFSLAGISL